MADILLDVKVVGSQDVLKAERALVKVQNSAKRLASEMDRGRMSSQAYFKGQTQLIRVLTRAGFSYEEARKSVFRYTKSMRASEVAVDQTTQSIQRATIAQQNMAAATNRNSRGIGRMSTITQQTGYQVGDFIVQVQSGTNAFVAFGQQATQVAGTLTLLGGKMVLIGSGLGVAIPLMTALGAAFMRTRKAAEDATDPTEEFANALKTLEQVDLSNASSQVSSFANTAIQKYSFLLETIEKVAEEERARGFTNIIDNFAPAEGIEKRRKSIENMIKLANDAGQETNANIRTQQRLLQDEVKTREVLLNISGKTRQKTAENLNTAIAQLKQNDLLSDELREQLTTFADQAGLTSVILTDMEKVTEEIEDQNKKTSDLSILTETLSGVFESMSMDNILSQMDSLNSKVGTAIFGAGTLWGRLRRLYKAGVEAAETAAYSQEIGGGRSMGRGGPTAKEIQQYDPRVQIAYNNDPATPNIPSGGGSAEKVQEDYLKKLQLEADRKLKLSKLSEEEARIKEITFQLIDKGLPVEQERIEKIVATEEALRKATEAEKQREQLMNTIEGHISNAFMTMVDGSKSVEDAFKGMLRNILLAIYEQQIAKPAASGIGNLISKGLGSLFGPGMTTGTPLTIPSSGVGSLLPNFDGGGFTGFGPRSGGLDGKGGMLAMVHPNETVVDHAKGQSSGGVTVVQNFSISANGDESVKRIIGQSMPQIAQYTTKTIVDERRKGGSMKAAFRG